MFTVLIRLAIPVNSDLGDFDWDNLKEIPGNITENIKVIEFSAIFLSNHSENCNDWRAICFAHLESIKWITDLVDVVDILEDKVLTLGHYII